MPQNPGNDTVTFNYVGVTKDRLHNVTPVASSSFSQTGCSMQTVSVRDKVNNAAYAEATHKLIVPFNTNTNTVEAEWFVTFNGESMRVTGRHDDLRDRWGRTDHLTFLCREESV